MGLGLLDRAKNAIGAVADAAASLLSGPVAIPRDQITTYCDLCQTIIARLAAHGHLYDIEARFIQELSDCADNCVWHYNAGLKKDESLQTSCELAIKAFWKRWDKEFERIATTRKMSASDVAVWQEDLWILALFRDLKHFHGVQGVGPHDLYCAVALEHDLYRRLKAIITKEKPATNGIDMPEIPKKK